MNPLILASTSRYRRELLARLALPFECVAPATDETPQPDEPPARLAARLAVAKAEAVAGRFPGAGVIGSDQVAELDGRLLGKPGGRDAALVQLSASSGRSVRFHTAFCLAAADGQQIVHIDLTEVRFRRLGLDEIARYLDAEAPFDCAGSFKCEGLGITLFESIRTQDPTALVGLPLIALSGALRTAGYRLP